MKKRSIITAVIIFIAAIFVLGVSYTSQISKGQLIYWLEFKSPQTSIKQFRGYRVLGDSNFINKDYARGFDCIRVYNAVGDTLWRGDVVIWCQTALDLVATVAYSADPETLTIALSGALEKCPLNISSTSYSLADACTLEISGLLWSQSTAVESIIHTATGVGYSVNYWDSLTQVRMLGWDANDSITVNAYRTQAVDTVTSANSILAAGVVHGGFLNENYILDKNWGYIATHGIYDSVKILGATTELLVGMPLHTSTTGRWGLGNATSTVGAGLGRLLESGNTDTYYKVFLTKE